MKQMDPRLIPLEQTDAISELIEKSNEKLTAAAVDSSDRAFNLGCSLGLLPAILFTLLSFLLTGGSWAASAIIALLMVIAVLGLANLAAYISRANTVKRVYENEVQSAISALRGELNLPVEDFDQVILESLPEGAPLSEFINSQTVHWSQVPEKIQHNEDE